MLLCYLAVAIDESPCLDVTDYPATPVGWAALLAYASRRADLDETPACPISGRTELYQDGQIVAVVVRA